MFLTCKKYSGIENFSVRQESLHKIVYLWTLKLQLFHHPDDEGMMEGQQKFNAVLFITFSLF